MYFIIIHCLVVLHDDHALQIKSIVTGHDYYTSTAWSRLSTVREAVAVLLECVYCSALFAALYWSPTALLVYWSTAL